MKEYKTIILASESAQACTCTNDMTTCMHAHARKHLQVRKHTQSVSEGERERERGTVPCQCTLPDLLCGLFLVLVFNPRAAIFEANVARCKKHFACRFAVWCCTVKGTSCVPFCRSVIVLGSLRFICSVIFLQSMRSAGLTPGAAMFEQMLDVVRDAALRDKSQSQYLETVVERMRECGVIPDSRAVMKAVEIAKNSRSNEASKQAHILLSRLPKQGRTHELLSSVLVCECANAGEKAVMQTMISELRGSPRRSLGVSLYKVRVVCAFSSQRTACV